jgi:uncharacterized protein YxeA
MEQEIYFPKDKKRDFVKIIGAVSGAILVIVILALIFIKKPKVPEDNSFIKNQIDSLAKANEALKAKQVSFDSASKKYEDAILDLDWKVQNVGEKETIIREYYHEKTKQPAKYNPKQVDSFFKDRYNY